MTVQNWARNIKTNDQSNPFIAPSYTTIANSAIAKDPLWAKYIVPSISNANANLPVDPQRVLDSLTDGVLKKEINPITAGDFMARIFQQSIAINNQVNQFKKIANYTQNSYSTKLQTFGTGLGSKPLNIADPNIAANLIVQNLVGKSGMIHWNEPAGPVPYVNELLTPGRTEAEKAAANGQ